MRAIIIFFLLTLVASCSESTGVERPTNATLKSQEKGTKIKLKKSPKKEKNIMKNNLEHIQMQQNEIKHRIKNLDTKIKKLKKSKKKIRCTDTNTCLGKNNK